MNKPTTIEECMRAFVEVLTPETQIELVKMSQDELVTTHHSLGRWIRNNWDLWLGGPLLEYMKSLGFIHPDDMSSSLIKEFWNRMNNQPSEMMEDIKKYAEYWKQQESQ
jgi:hypothetical protein